MPWTTSDVERFKKGLSDKEKKEWAKIANATLASQLKKGTKELEAEIIAIKKANSMFGGKARAMKYSDLEHTEVKLVLAEAGTDGEYQLVLPRGTTYDSWYGELIFTNTFMKEMVKNQNRLKNTRAFLNEQHDRGKACAWADDIKATDEGLEVKWDFTTLGKSLVEEKIYKYFSAEIGGVTDVDTGEYVYPVFRGCALTNSPVMKNLPEVHLQEVTDGGNEVNFEDILEALKMELSDEQKAKIRELLGDADLSEQLEAKEEVITSLNDKITELQKQIDLTEAEKIENKLSEAEKAGKITPANRDKWKERLTKDYDTFSEVIDEMAVAVKLDEEAGSELDAEDGGKPKLNCDDYTGKEGVKETSKDANNYV